MRTKARIPAIPIEPLVEFVIGLEPDARRHLWQALNDQIEQEEEDFLEKNTDLKQRITTARQDYLAGRYVTIDELIPKTKSRP